MVKYNEKFKRKVVDAYLAGEGGYLSIAEKFDIPSTSTVRKWVSVFRRFGKDSFVIKKSHKTYTVQFKLDVLNYKIRTGDSFIEVALKYGFNEPSIIANWFKKWQSEGIEGLSGTKGRQSLTNKPSKEKTVKIISKEQQLEKENELLRAENAYLKKLRASGINIPNRLRK